MVLVNNNEDSLLDSEWGKLVRVDPFEEDDNVDDQQHNHASFLDDVYDSEGLYEAEAVQDEDEAAFADIPVASATLLDPFFLNPIDTSISNGRPRLSFDKADPTVDALMSYSRPQYIFASARFTGCVIKKNLGIQLKTRRRMNGLVCGTVVSGISEDSPFYGCNIQPGDHVVSVNNFLCSSVKSGRVLELLRSTKQQDDVVSICLYNAKGDPNTVSSSVMKPDRTTKVGVALQMTRGAVRTSRVDKDGLFANSLLMPRHRCMMINGISCSHVSLFACFR